MEVREWEGALPQEDIEDYHQREDYSSSQIKFMLKSPYHYKKYVIDGESLESTSLGFGSLAHTLINENKYHLAIPMPELSPIETIVEGKRPGTTRKETLTIKAQKENFLAVNQDKIVLSQSDYQRVSGMREALMNNETAKTLFNEDDLIEQGYRYYDDKNDISCRFRVDRINFRLGHIIDYKTCANAHPDRFKFDILRYGYHISAAHYMVGTQRLFRDQIKNFIFIAQETKAPYAIGFYKVSAVDLMFGENIRTELINKIKKCKALNKWPHYTDGVKELSLPDYSFTTEDNDDDTETLEQASF